MLSKRETTSSPATTRLIKRSQTSAQRTNGKVSSCAASNPACSETDRARRGKGVRLLMSDIDQLAYLALQTLDAVIRDDT